RMAGPGLPEGPPGSEGCFDGRAEALASYVQLYYDDGGVHRVYGRGLRGGEWTREREGPPFAQRFRGTFSPDGRTIGGRWELQEPGQAWRTDFDVTYTRVD